MAISSQTLKEILEAFKSQLYDTLNDKLDAFGDCLNVSFRSIQDSLDNMQERFLMEDIRMSIIKKYMLGMISMSIAMIGIWIVVISGMTTTSIFYLMTLLHLL
jgi:phage-related protein